MALHQPFQQDERPVRFAEKESPSPAAFDRLTMRNHDNVEGRRRLPVTKPAKRREQDTLRLNVTLDARRISRTQLGAGYHN
jgi:hypothetical protein